MAFLSITALLRRKTRSDGTVYRELVEMDDMMTNEDGDERSTNGLDPVQIRHVKDENLFFWKVTTAFISLICILLIGYIVVLSEQSSPIVQYSHMDIYRNHQPNIDQETNVFNDLNSNELIKVRDYILSIKEFNLVRQSNAKLHDNFIYMIESHIPTKQDVLNHLYNNKKKPLRQAKVILMNGAKNPPNIEEYIVEPVDNPSRHFLHSNGAKGTKSIPFYRRPFTTNEHLLIADFLQDKTEILYPLMRESFGLWYHNCTDSCLLFIVDGVPASFKIGDRKAWISFSFKKDGFDLLMLPLQILVDFADRKLENWRLLKISYNNQLFDSVDDLAFEYKTNTLKKIKFHPSKETVERASFRPRGKRTTEKPLRGPQLVEPDGRRFQVNGRQVKYLGWDFYIGMRPLSGSSLYNVMFNESRIAYEVSVQEATSFYSSHDPRASVAVYLDSTLGLGIGSEELIIGEDCPYTSVLLDATYLVDSEEPFINKKSICVFEHNNAMPLRRHRAMKYDKRSMTVDDFEFVGSLTDHVLVVRHIATAENYDFVFDYVFHQNGVMEVKVSTAGYVIGTPFYEEQKQFGYEVMNGISAPLHDHYILYRVDMDVDGTENSYNTLDIKTQTITPTWDENARLFQKYKVLDQKVTEKEALLHYNFSQPKYLLFSNENTKNLFGQPKSYRIQPKSMVKQLFPSDYPATISLAWTDYQMVVTKYKEEERVSEWMYNLFGMEEPHVDFKSFFNDDESTVNKDLVAWVTVGGLHVPNTEDIPTTFTSSNTYSFTIRPFGFYDFDPSMQSRNGIYITNRDHEKMSINNFGLNIDLVCFSDNRTTVYGI